MNKSEIITAEIRMHAALETGRYCWPFSKRAIVWVIPTSEVSQSWPLTVTSIVSYATVLE